MRRLALVAVVAGVLVAIVAVALAPPLGSPPNSARTPAGSAGAAALPASAAIARATPSPAGRPSPNGPATATASLAASPLASDGADSPAPSAPIATTSSTTDSLGLTASYSVDASFNWASRAVAVDTTATVRNTSAGAVGQLVFNLTPLTLASVHVDSVTVAGGNAAFSRDNPEQALMVSLPSSLAPGASTTVEISYDGALNASSSGDDWLFARTSVLTAYRWIPWLSRPIAWAPNELGDPWVTSISPRVQVTITTDQPLEIAASGQRTSVSANGLVQQFTATNVRDFNLTAAPDYRTRSRSVSIGGRPVRITLYYRTLPAATVLRWAAKALKSYSAHIGPYVYNQLNIGEADANADPIESPGHFWVPAGTPPRELPWMVSHETGHQWFYAAVGNDQVEQPFADEALVDFMARNLTNTWAKSPRRCGQQQLDQPISYYGSCYPWVIYVQGNLYLRAYYRTVGASAFWQGVSSYFHDYKWQFGGTRQLLDSLDAASGICYPHWLRFPTLYSPHC